MDNKRRAKGLEISPHRSWPVQQQRKVEKLKEERLIEFERACMDSFEWLENYYQGCVYAANQNRPRSTKEAHQIQDSMEIRAATPASKGRDSMEFHTTPPSKVRDSMEIHTTPGSKVRDSTEIRITPASKMRGSIEIRSTPGSKARDSMTLISPITRSGSKPASMRTRDSNFSTPGLSRGPSASSGTTLELDVGQEKEKEIEEDEEGDGEVEILNANYKRPRSSPFRDSTAPVRFGSPERDDAKRPTENFERADDGAKMKVENSGEPQDSEFSSASARNKAVGQIDQHSTVANSKSTEAKVTPAANVITRSRVGTTLPEKLKRSTRTVLPDSTLTARSLLLLGISKAGTPTSPKKDAKRDMKQPEPRQQQQHRQQQQQQQQQPQKQLEFTSETSSKTENTGSAPTAVAQNQSERPSFLDKTVLPDVKINKKDEVEEPYDVPPWAAGEELEKAMQKQNNMNPEDIFGPLPSLDMSDIFPGSH
ncbi:hypothetical protein BGZ65_011717 [Modicella reniformis]|uniref:Inner centromere protein ARK-binding domain-containing protein n=1 Tax=Modicella reniformis TaxID=1440133 RepID=A0A9P6LTU6_9FUNG|nr:hypothetical protein BGZ65_011717 [Modicella reniformis]